MSNKTQKRYWQSLPILSESPEAEAAATDPFAGGPAPLSRRRFLEAAGFTVSAAALSGCGRAPVTTALPFVEQPEGVIPGRTQTYASTCAGCAAGCGLLVEVRDGRPLKMEGMPEHPISRGGLCAVGQASPLGLYDSHRLSGPFIGAEQSDWDKIDREITGKLIDVADAGGAVRVVTATVTSPTLQATIDKFLARYDDARHVTLDVLGCSAILDAHALTHGARVLPHYRFDQASVIVSFGADFLGTWISPVEFTAAWRSRRVPTADDPEMSYHVQLEGRMSLTGSNADKRYRLAPNDYGVVLSHLATKLAALAETPAPDGALGESPISDEILSELAERLWTARGESLVICDSQDVAVQRLVNFVNHTLAGYGTTLDIERPSRQQQGSDRDVLALVDELTTGKVAALLVLGTDLTHNLPSRDALAEAIAKVPLTVSLADRRDDFASLAGYVCPDQHALESWADTEAVMGVVSLTQPLIEPIGNTRSALESFARWSDSTESAYDLIRRHWRGAILARAGQQPFEPFWDQAVHDGFVEVATTATETIEFQAGAVQLVPASAADNGYTLALYHKIGLPDGRHAENPWLQELPDPITKVVWDNYVCVAPGAARELDVVDGDVVEIATADGGTTLQLPALVQPGQHDRVLAVALAYGVPGTQRFADIGPEWIESRPTVASGELVGKNAAGFIEASRDNGGEALSHVRTGISIKKTGRRHPLAVTQTYNSMDMPPEVAPYGGEVREPIQETSLREFAKNPASGAEVHHHGGPQHHDNVQEHTDEQDNSGEQAHSDEQEHGDEQHPAEDQLWPEDHPNPGHSWGMVIDLNACTGCSSCLIACQSENNVPVVGKDEVRRRRDMHWIRLDRYYSGDGDDVDVTHQPMMCQHCHNAPCETVCPVLATVHGEEGLNQQAYNRCVGTRYCANNCPYKVRRFNWFKYHHDDALQNLALNPDVTVRTRGVMEKCSMCVQRIELGKIEASVNDQPLADGDVQTACQQSCPADAILFGDMNDPDSRIHQALKDPRRYRVLEELNVRPAVSYLRVVKNRDEVADAGDAETGSADTEVSDGGDHV